MKCHHEDCGNKAVEMCSYCGCWYCEEGFDLNPTNYELCNFCYDSEQDQKAYKQGLKEKGEAQ